MSEKQPNINEAISALVDNELSELELHRLLRDMEGNGSARQVWMRYQSASAVLRNEYPLNPQWDISANVRQALMNESAPELASDSTSQADINLNRVNDNAAVVQDRVTRPRSILSNLTRFAIAASVTLAVIVGVQHYNEGNGGRSPAILADNIDPSNVNPSDVNPATDYVLQNSQLQSHAVGFRSPPIQTATVSDGASVKVSSRPVETARVVLQNESTLNMDDAEIKLRLNNYMLRHAEHSALNSGSGMMPFARVVHFEEQ